MRIAGRALELIPLDFAPCARVPRDPDEEFDMSSAIARSQSHTVTLPAALDFDVAATPSRTLDNCRGEDVVIDASYAQKLGAQCFQVLHAAEQAWKADNRLFTHRQRAGPLSRRTERLRSRPQRRLTFTKPSTRCCRRGGRIRLTTALSEHGYIFVDARSWSS
jgi:hypothetical protein